MIDVKAIPINRPKADPANAAVVLVDDEPIDRLNVAGPEPLPPTDVGWLPRRDFGGLGGIVPLAYSCEGYTKRYPCQHMLGLRENSLTNVLTFVLIRNQRSVIKTSQL